MDQINFTPALCAAIAVADAPTVGAAAIICGDSEEVIALKLARVLLAQNPALADTQADAQTDTQAPRGGLLGKIFGG